MTKYYGREKMFERRYKRTPAACLAGVANQAVITNVTALLFVSFSGLYGFNAQMFADVLLTFLIGPFLPESLRLPLLRQAVRG